MHAIKHIWSKEWTDRYLWSACGSFIPTDGIEAILGQVVHFGVIITSVKPYPSCDDGTNTLIALLRALHQDHP